MAAAAGVVVWEWQDEFGCWRPYDPKITNFLETNKTSTIPLQLGAVDLNMFLYQVDLQNMRQIRQGTGTQRPVRRMVYPGNSPIARGITWQWEADIPGRWNDFDTEVSEILEDSFSKKQQFVDLTVSKFKLPYHIDLQQMKQKRVETGRLRNVQRVFTQSSYPIDLSVPNPSKKRSGPVVNKNATLKKSKMSSSLGSSTSGISGLTSGVSQSLAGSTASTVPVQNMVNIIPVSSTSGQQSSVPAVQIGTLPGPLTRNRYQQTMAQQGQTMFMPQPVSSSMHLNPYLSQNVPSAHSTSIPMFGMGHTTAFQPVPFPASSVTGSTTGNHLNVGPPFAFMSNPNASAGQPPGVFPPIGNLNTSLLFGGSRSSRIRPSVPNATGVQQTGALHPKHDRIPNYPAKSSKRGDKQQARVVTAEDILNSYVSPVNSPPADEDCCICYEKLIEASGHGTGSPQDHLVLQLEKCSHMFHKLCLTAMYDSGSKDGSLQCPTCKTIYGERQGNCPKGEMEYRVIGTELAGFEGCQTIQILYHIHGGTQGPEHPHPGKKFTTRGFPRIGYLPDCDKGRKVLQLLIIAWKRRLTFTVGTSTTTGEEGTVTWNEIHHKTELGSNFSGHGYPDEKYLDNVLMELAIHGITEKDLPSS